jgi:hypothetical protein
MEITTGLKGACESPELMIPSCYKRSRSPFFTRSPGILNGAHGEAVSELECIQLGTPVPRRVREKPVSNQ